MENGLFFEIEVGCWRSTLYSLQLPWFFLFESSGRRHGESNANTFDCAIWTALRSNPHNPRSTSKIFKFLVTSLWFRRLDKERPHLSVEGAGRAAVRGQPQPAGRLQDVGQLQRLL